MPYTHTPIMWDQKKKSTHIIHAIPNKVHHFKLRYDNIHSYKYMCRHIIVWHIIYISHYFYVTSSAYLRRVELDIEIHILKTEAIKYGKKLTFSHNTASFAILDEIVISFCFTSVIEYTFFIIKCFKYKTSPCFLRGIIEKSLSAYFIN